MSQFPNSHPWAAPFQPTFVPSLLGPIDLVAAPSQATVQGALQEARDQTRSNDPANDALLLRLLIRACDFAGKLVPGHRQLLTATYSQPVISWWEDLVLPRPPLQSVAGVYYIDVAGNEQAVDPSLYLVRAPWRQPGQLFRAPFKWWPIFQGDRRYPVRVQFVAGYGTWSDLPPTLQQAALLILSEFYWRRESSEADVATRAVMDLCEAEGWGSYA